MRINMKREILTSTLSFKRIAFLLIFVQAMSIILASCKLTRNSYSTQDQYILARSRVESMKEQLELKLTLEKENIHHGEAIFFTVHFINKADIPITLRIPQQSGILDIDHPNTSLLYSITPLGKSISLETPLSILNSTPYIFITPVQSSEFEVLSPNSTIDVKLELPNIVYLKREDQWEESSLPSGQYIIDVAYENLYIGYEVETNSSIQFVDKLAWVGRINAEPVTLTILP